MQVLPDIVAAEPRVVFCGLAGAASTKLRDHYYETPGNSFWESLHLSGFSPRRLRPDEDRLVADLGLGLTDLVGHWDPRSVDLDALVAKLETWRPEWIAFTSKGVAAEAARADGVRRPGLGPRDWYLGGAQVFVLPGVSGANQRHDYDGRPTRLAWWRDLAALAL
ncbi:mismatch-specific DNA-glycosylase [Nocardioides dongxiaopingii]|uniref:mismatch-specific DNA-glycosylase n=1 Tax=Nocardioides dongxiaopingii TaxID=2576036 RepID=UPI0010C768A7|nr:mismatch-specific DNA-glycosylase [Nocardioides dongxiaopingii]